MTGIGAGSVAGVVAMRGRFDLRSVCMDRCDMHTVAPEIDRVVGAEELSHAARSPFVRRLQVCERRKHVQRSILEEKGEQRVREVVLSNTWRRLITCLRRRSSPVMRKMYQPIS